MSITPGQACELLDGATPGPWIMHRYVPEDYIRVTGEDLKDIADNGIVEDGDARLIAAAPDLAQTIATMRWEYGVEQATGVTQWFRSLPMAEAHAEVRGAFRLVRRLVGPVEEAE